jgi:hypothetical protein
MEKARAEAQLQADSALATAEHTAEAMDVSAPAATGRACTTDKRAKRAAETEHETVSGADNAAADADSASARQPQTKAPSLYKHGGA